VEQRVVHDLPAPAQFLEQPLGRAALTLRQLGFLPQDPRQSLDPVAELWRWLNAPSVSELRLVAANDLAHCRASTLPWMFALGGVDYRKLRDSSSLSELD
jgi:hypothetical protein